VIEFLAIAWLLISTLVGAFFFIKYYVQRRESEAGLKDLKIVREIPFEDKPYVVDYLFNSRITPKGMTATFIDLLRRKHFSMEEIPNQGMVGKLLNLKDFLFSRLESEDHLTRPEKYLLELIFTREETRFLAPKISRPVNQITLSEIVGIRDSSYESLYLLWKPFTEREIETNKTKENFLDFSLSDRFSKISIALFILNALFSFLAFVFFKQNPVVIGFVFASVPTLVFLAISLFPTILCRKTKMGLEHYKEWLGLQKFFDDFGYLHDKDPEEIVLWEKFLVFGTLFGNAKKINSRFEPLFTLRKRNDNSVGS